MPARFLGSGREKRRGSSSEGEGDSSDLDTLCLTCLWGMSLVSWRHLGGS